MRNKPKLPDQDGGPDNPAVMSSAVAAVCFGPLLYPQPKSNVAGAAVELPVVDVGIPTEMTKED